MKKVALILLVLPLLAACNTIEGIGEDVEATGKVVKETARDVKD